jgi:hypothetical protein
METDTFQSNSTSVGGDHLSIKKWIFSMILILLIVVVALSIVGYLVQSGYFRHIGLNERERVNMMASLGTSTPLTAKEQRQVTSSLGTTTKNMNSQEQLNMLKSLK